jgi:hypothetical protein
VFLIAVSATSEPRRLSAERRGGLRLALLLLQTLGLRGLLLCLALLFGRLLLLDVLPRNRAAP